jgi:hypothetical protein
VSPKVFITFSLALLTIYGVRAQEVNISLAGENATVIEAIRAIEDQTDYHVSYNKNSLDTSRGLRLPGETMPLKGLLDHIIDGVALKYMIHGNYIAFVPAADNSRPQVRLQPRTTDEYEPNGPNDLSAASVPRPTPVVETPAPAKGVFTPKKSFYSDYTQLDIFEGVQTSLPRFALKTNILYGAATITPNIAAEVALSHRSTVEVSYSNNPWNYKAEMPSNKKLLHGIARAEYRYWLCERFSGHFLGVHALYSEYNVSGRDIPLLFDKEYRYHGNAWGGGINYGYALPIANRWNLEFTAGFGMVQMKYDRYGCLTCDRNAEPMTKTWFGPTRLGINLVFLIK